MSANVRRSPDPLLAWARLSAALGVALVLAASALVSPQPARAQTGGKDRLTADLDGTPIKLEDVANWYCDDFSYPVIHCFSDPMRLEARTQALTATTAVTYVTVYDYTAYAGSYMQMSEDYTVLAWIGWNDRISSFKGRNSEDGHFYVDWFYGGTGYYFCCNQLAGSLGTFDNQFSSVHRN
jgi:hypothetical protein